MFADPVKRVDRVTEYHCDLKSFTEARSICIEGDGDLLVIGKTSIMDDIITMMNETCTLTQ